MTDDRPDVAALVLAATDGRDESFLLQPVQRAPHGGATQAESLGHRAFGDARAGWQMPPHDEAAQLLVDTRDGVQTGVVGR